MFSVFMGEFCVNSIPYLKNQGNTGLQGERGEAGPRVS